MDVESSIAVVRKQVQEAMQRARIHPALIFAASRCDRLVSHRDVKSMPLNALMGWEDAIEQYCQETETPLPGDYYLSFSEYARIMGPILRDES